MYFKDKIVWITGASSGIGEACLRAFIEAEAKVVASSENEPELQRVRNSLGNKAENCLVLPLDLSRLTNAKELVDIVIKKWGRIDILMNNGGISTRTLVKETSMEIHRKVMEINYFGAITLTQAVLPYMLQQGGGHITATTSIAGKFGFPLRSAYCASKHALQGYFEALRTETTKENIKITIIIPGRVQTNISKNALTKDGTPHGKLDAGQAGGITTEKAARCILGAIKSYKKEVLVGGKELLMVYIRRFFPRIFFWLAPKIKST